MTQITMTPDALKRARAILNISQAQLARELGLSRPSIARLESGQMLNGRLRYPIKPVVALAVEYLVLIRDSARNASGSST